MIARSNITQKFRLSVVRTSIHCYRNPGMALANFPDDRIVTQRRFNTPYTTGNSTNDDGTSSSSGFDSFIASNNNTDESNKKKVGTFHKGAVMKGTVKFYLREKGFGFIVADGRPDTDIFVHRANIECTHPLSEAVLNATVRYPYLKQNERVRFVLSHDMGTVKAMNVTWLNGDPIPPERKNYLGGVHERANRIFGEVCMNIMKNKQDMRDPFTSEEYEKMQNAYIEARRQIEHSEQILIELGMDLSQFPTIKGPMSSRGRYLFQHEVDEENQKAIEKAIAAANNVQPSSTEHVAKTVAKSFEPGPTDHLVDDLINNIDSETGEPLKKASPFDSPAPEVDDIITDDTTTYSKRR